MDPLPTRQTLLIKIRDAEDDEAWNEFVELYTPLVYRYALSRGISRTDADDVIQEVMKSIASAIKKFDYDPDKGTFRSWLFTVTRSKLMNHFNQRKRHPEGTGRTTVHELIEKHPDPREEADWELDYRKQLFRWASEKVRSEFKEATWLAFWQTAVEERPSEEVAESLDLSVGAVYIAKSRVIARLRERVQSVTGEPEFPPQLV